MSRISGFKEMKVAYLTSTFPYGVGESFLIAEIEALARQGVELYIVPLHPRGKRRAEWTPPAATRSLEQKLLSPQILKSMFVYLWRNPARCIGTLFFLLRHSGLNRHALKNFAVFPKAVWLATWLPRENIRHIHAHWGAATSTMAMICSRLTHISWSLTCHRWDIYDNNLLALKSREAQFVRFISHKGMNDAKKLGARASSCVVIPMGVSVSNNELSRRITRRTPVLLCAANLLEVKGHRYLIEAVRLLRDGGHDVRLLIAGDGPLREELNRQIETLALSGVVTLLGSIPHNRLIDMYIDSKVDIFVLPSVDLGNGHHEGVPVSLMEAMAFGVPVVSTRTGSIEELVPPCLSLTVPDKDANALATCLNRLLRDEDFYMSTSEAVTRIIHDSWSSDVTAERLAQLIANSQVEL